MMRKLFRKSICFLLIACLLIVNANTIYAKVNTNKASMWNDNKVNVEGNIDYSSSFIQNKDLLDKAVKYFTNVAGGTIFYEKNGATTYLMPLSTDQVQNEPQFWVFKENFINSNQIEVKGSHESKVKYHYLKGNDSSKHYKNANAYQKLEFGQIYDNIEHTSIITDSNIEKIYTIYPGGDPSDIQIHIEGANHLSINEKGFLQFVTDRGALSFTKPYAYQNINNELVEIDVEYSISQDMYGFSVGSYNENYPLIIDPLIASSYIGQTGIYTKVADISKASDGNIYVTGKTSSAKFPTTVGAYDETLNGYYDVFISKFDKEFKTLLASTYIGGSGSKEDVGQVIRVDSNNNVYVAGYTEAADFPMVSTPYDGDNDSGNEIFIIKMNATLDSLLASTYLSATISSRVHDFIIEDTGDVLVAGETSSGLATTIGTYQEDFGGAYDGFLSRLDGNLTSLKNSTYIGGNLTDKIMDIELSSNGNIIISGYSQSSNYPTTLGAYSQNHSGGMDAFVSILSSDMTNLISSTLLGGTGQEYTKAMASDFDGNIYITGETTSTNFPVTIGSYSETNSGGSYDGFVAKLNNTLSYVVSATYIGGSSSDYMNRLALDTSGHVIVSGKTMSSDFPVTSDAFDNTYNSTDGFMFKLDNNLDTLNYSSFIGGAGSDFITAMQIDEHDTLYIAGETSSYDFPVTDGTYQTSPYSGISFCMIITDSLTGFDAAEKVKIKTDNSSNIVNPAYGAYTNSKNLLKVTGALDLSFSIYYNSIFLNDSPLGKGWNFSFNTSLNKLPNENVEISWGDGTKKRFSLINNSYLPYDEINHYKDLSFDGSIYTLTTESDETYVYDTGGYIINASTKTGQTLSYEYDVDNKLIKVIEDASGRYIQINYNLDKNISSIEDSLGRSVKFEYNINNCLTKIINANNEEILLAYNGNNQLMSETNHDGITLYVNEYDNEGRIISRDDGITTNQLQLYSYDDSSTLNQIITTITDRVGNTRKLVYNGNYQLIETVDEFSNTEYRYTYNPYGQILSVTDERGNAYIYGYDDAGELINVVDPKDTITSYTYDSKGNLLTITNPENGTTTLTYDENNNVIDIQDALLKHLKLEYDTKGQLIKTTSKENVETNYEYNLGQVSKITNSSGYYEKYTYDSVGRLIKITDIDNNEYTLSYDNMDRILSITNPLLKQKVLTYDCNGLMLSMIDYGNNLTTYTYDNNLRLTTVTDANNQSIQYEYNGNDQLIKEIDRNDNYITYTYDIKGRLISQGNNAGYVTRYEYDILDNMESIYDTNNNRIQYYTYDVLNYPLTITDALNNVVTKAYDTSERLTNVFDELSNSTAYEYNEKNELIKVIDANNQVLTQSFNGDQQLLQVKDQNKNERNYSYDIHGRLSQLEYANKVKTTYQYNNRDFISQTTNGRGQNTTYTYDSLGRLVSYTDPIDTVTYTYDDNSNLLTIVSGSDKITYTYDNLDRVTSYTDLNGNVIGYEYDYEGNLTKLIYPDKKEVTYEYNQANQLVKVMDWSNHTTTYEYDNNGQLIKTIRPNGTIETIGYDLKGQILWKQDEDSLGNIINRFDYTYDNVGNITYESTTNNNYTNSYTDLYQLQEQSIKDGHDSLIDTYSYSFDAAGNITTISTISGTLATMTYTDGNRLANYNGNIITYDDDGNMIAGPLNSTMQTFTYDARNRLTLVDTTMYEYDSLDNRISVTKSGEKTNFVVNPATFYNQVLTKTAPDGKITYYVYGLGLISEETDNITTYYHYDLRGSTIALTDSTETVTDTYEYDTYGTLISHTGNSNTSFQYVGRWGIITDNNGLLYMNARYYNPEIRRFINEDSYLGNAAEPLTLNLYTYCHNNPVVFIDPTGHSSVGVTDDSDILWWLWQLISKGLSHGTKAVQFAKKASPIYFGIYLFNDPFSIEAGGDMTPEQRAYGGTAIQESEKAYIGGTNIDEEVLQIIVDLVDDYGGFEVIGMPIFEGEFNYTYTPANDPIAQSLGLVTSDGTIKVGDITLGGRIFTDHGALRANQRGFSKEIIDNIINNNYKNRKSKVDYLGRKTWEYTDNRGNKVVLNENDAIITVYSPAPGGHYIPKK